MKNLPNERKANEFAALDKFIEEGELTICEPCNCGSQIRHNNGGNYHQIVTLKKEGEHVFVQFSSTCELIDEEEWQQVDKMWPPTNVAEIIHECGDWLSV
jgi:hypothetical protein